MRNPRMWRRERSFPPIPAAGANLNAGDSVNIVVSSGVGTVMTTVPDVMDLEEADAVSMLESKNLKVSITYVENDADAGLVFYQSIKSSMRCRRVPW